jgi:hypothetical protein
VPKPVDPIRHDDADESCQNDARHSNEDFISVHEAASRLGVSTSKIYRMPREHCGLFRIINFKRRVLVNRIDFERHLSTQSNSTTAQAPRHVSFTGSENAHDVHLTQVAPTSGANSHTGCGQRDLVIPVGGPSIVFYMA